MSYQTFRKYWRMTFNVLIGAVILFTAAAFLQQGCSKSTAEKERDARIAEMNAASARADRQADSIRAARESTAGAEAETGGAWAYNTTSDAMGNESSTARCTSTNTVSLSFPYEGAQHGELVVRKHSEYGRDVYFTIERGQITPDYDDPTIMVRFDDEKARAFTVAKAADGSSNLIFISNYKGFVNRLKKASRVALKVPLYQHGEQIFEFDVQGFDMTKL